MSAVRAPAPPANNGIYRIAAQIDPYAVMDPLDTGASVVYAVGCFRIQLVVIIGEDVYRIEVEVLEYRIHLAVCDSEILGGYDEKRVIIGSPIIPIHNGGRRTDRHHTDSGDEGGDLQFVAPTDAGNIGFHD